MTKHGNSSVINVVSTRKVFLMGLDKLSPSTLKKGTKVLPFLHY